MGLEAVLPGPQNALYVCYVCMYGSDSCLENSFRDILQPLNAKLVQFLILNQCSISLIMPTPPQGGGIKRFFCLTSDVCLSRTSSLTRGLRQIDTEVAHVTRDADTTFKVKRSKVQVTRTLWLVVLAGQHGHTVMVTYHNAYNRVTTCTPGWRHIVEACTRLQLVHFILKTISMC